LWGGADRILPRAHLDFFRQHLPSGSAIHTPPEFGHAPFLHRADEVSALLVRFARSLC
jgi:pimeloyl-ACP methyl ester carboxylesterase